MSRVTAWHLTAPALACVGLSFVLAHAAAASIGTEVQTRSGPIRCTAASDVTVFKGVPYAAAPVGERRWRPPAPPPSWTAVRDATKFGPQCPQAARGGRVASAETARPSSEDCLTLNVWTPASSSDDGLPVMVWFHGGGFAAGSGAWPQYDAAALARRGVIVVTVNYRLGALGFLAHPALSRESEIGVSGNYGLLDQIAALRWVQDNIGSFGGDPANVTAVGQSAGGISIAFHATSSLGRGLFQRAIVQSGGYGWAGPKPRLRTPHAGFPSAEAHGEAVAPDIDALRSMPADEVLAKLPSAPTLSAGWVYGPIIDDYVVVDDPLGGRGQPHVPLLLGHNSDEASFFANDAPRTPGQYSDLVHGLFPRDIAPEVLTRYPARNDNDVRSAVLRMFSEFRYVAPTVVAGRALSERGTVYMYRFSRVAPVTRSRWGGAAHTAEIPYVFDHTDDAAEFESVDRAIAAAMAGAWVQFAKTGNPNGADLPRWPAYRSPGYELLEYGDETAVRSNASSPEADFFGKAIEDMRANDPVWRTR
jgi:para-nitrobenzyl esterase